MSSHTAKEPNEHAQTWGWGIIGAGNIAAKFADDLQYVPGARKIGVYARTASNAERFAEQFGFDRAFETMDALLASDAIDVIYIATPHTAHMEQALAAIEAGKAVLIEKPIAMTADQARAIQVASEANSIFAMEALWSRFLPAIQRAKAIIDSGVLGEVRRAEASLHFFRAYDEKDRLFAPELGGGVVHDLGVYPISVATYLFGNPEVSAATWYPAPNGVNDEAAVDLICGTVPVNMTTGFAGTGENSFIVYGSKGTLRIESHFLRSTQVTVWGKPKDRLPQSRGNLIKRAIYRLGLNGGKTDQFDLHGTGLHYQASAVQAALGQGLIAHPIMPLSESVNVMAVIEEILNRPPSMR